MKEKKKKIKKNVHNFSENGISRYREITTKYHGNVNYANNV